jgi:hypothetical protein
LALCVKQNSTSSCYGGYSLPGIEGCGQQGRGFRDDDAKA